MVGVGGDSRATVGFAEQVCSSAERALIAIPDSCADGSETLFRLIDGDLSCFSEDEKRVEKSDNAEDSPTQGMAFEMKSNSQHQNGDANIEQKNAKNY